jgi:hypothetical protein
MLPLLLEYVVELENVDAMDGCGLCICVCGDGGRGKLKEPRPWCV